MLLRLVHRNGEVKEVEAGMAGEFLQIYWPVAGWYRVFRSSGRVAGAKSWRVHPDDLPRIALPRRPRKKKPKGVSNGATVATNAEATAADSPGLAQAVEHLDAERRQR